MKVKELIEKLQELDQDRDITIDGYDIKQIIKCTDVRNGEHFYAIER